MDRPLRGLVAAALVVATSLGSVAVSPAGATSGAEDPPLSVPEARLDAALHCSTPFDDTREPVLLVHGTFTTDDENWGWNYRPDLVHQGFDVCTVRLPNLSLDDIQIQAEYVVHAVRRMAAMAGSRKVDILGHSQGGLQPRWMTRFFPHTRALVDDLVTLAAPHHGTTLEGLSGVGCGACFQMTAGSRFLARLNSGDETPGDVDYTSIFTELADEMVQPQPTASTLFGGGVNVANISIQGIGGQCAARPVTHASIVIDSVTHDLVLDALVNDGPASVARAQPDCNPANPYFPILPEAVGGETTVEVPTTDLTIPPESILSEEPTTRYYARPVLPRYLDVPPDHWAYWEIAWADASELAVSDGRWIPDRPGSRAQTVMWLWRLAGGPTGSPPAAEFGHVADDAWYRDGLDWAAAEGIVHSVDGRFRPRRQIDRANLAWWLWTYAGRPVGSPDHSFVDVPDGAWYEDGLDWVAAQGIVTGYPGNRFEPKRVSSRAAVVGTLYRLEGALA